MITAVSNRTMPGSFLLTASITLGTYTTRPKKNATFSTTSSTLTRQLAGVSVGATAATRVITEEVCTRRCRCDTRHRARRLQLALWDGTEPANDAQIRQRRVADALDQWFAKGPVDLALNGQ